jgi:hypothetical protein
MEETWSPALLWIWEVGVHPAVGMSFGPLDELHAVSVGVG